MTSRSDMTNWTNGNEAGVSTEPFNEYSEDNCLYLPVALLVLILNTAVYSSESILTERFFFGS